MVPRDGIEPIDTGLGLAGVRWFASSGMPPKMPLKD